MDKDLLHYCKNNDFHIEELTEEQFSKIENSLDYSFYKLGIEFKKLGNEILNILNKNFRKKE